VGNIGQRGRHAALAYFLRVRASSLSAFRLISGRANLQVSRFSPLTQLANCDGVAIGSEQASGDLSIFAKYRRGNRPFSLVQSVVDLAGRPGRQRAVRPARGARTTFEPFRTDWDRAGIIRAMDELNAAIDRH
jgi:hypothetical protein